METIEQAIATKFLSFISVWFGMFGGMFTGVLATLGEEPIVAGTGVLIAIGGLFLKAWHNYAVRRGQERSDAARERLEYAKLTDEQRKIFDEYGRT